MSTVSAKPPVPANEHRAEILAHLDEVLSSTAFAPSRRCQQFLRFVVEETLDGRSETIKERTIATTVFGRNEHYEPAGDSIVRVKAVEVRRRLSQFYAATPTVHVRIELPSGTYVPTFCVTGNDLPPAPAKTATWHRSKRVAVAGSILLVLAFGAIMARPLFRMAARGPIEDLWQPMLTQNVPVLICLPSPTVNQLRPEAARRAGATPAGEISITLPRSEIITLEQYYVGTGAAYGGIQFASILASHQRPFNVKIGNEVSFADLRNQPALLLGAFSSRWTVDIVSGLRFRFGYAPDGSQAIIDTKDSSKVWYEQPGDNKTSKRALALAVRLNRSSGGNAVMVAAGLTARGTYSAAEFLTSTESFTQFLKSAPPNWRDLNFEVVLASDVHDNLPGPPAVQGFVFW